MLKKEQIEKANELGIKITKDEEGSNYSVRDMKGIHRDGMTNDELVDCLGKILGDRAGDFSVLSGHGDYTRGDDTFHCRYIHNMTDDENEAADQALSQFEDDQFRVGVELARKDALSSDDIDRLQCAGMNETDLEVDD